MLPRRTILLADALKAFEPRVKAAQKALEEGTCPGNDFLGWLHLASGITPEHLADLKGNSPRTPRKLRHHCRSRYWR